MFGVGSPRCPRCNKPVYFNEEKLACGRKYHESCFKCIDCKVRLDSTTLQDKNNELYCITCYKKRWGPKGYGYGGAHYDTGMHAKQQVEIPKLNPPPPFKPPPPTKRTFVSRNTHSQPKPKPVVSSSTPAFRVLNKFCSECGKGPQTRRFCGECGAKNLLDEGQTVNQVHDVKQFSRATNITRSTVNQNPNSFRAAAAPPLKKKVGGWKPKGNVCPSCNKSVFFNEEARAVGKVWHQVCLRCKTCRKGLDSSTVNDAKGPNGSTLVFCSACYAKAKGPKGFGIGGANTHTQ